jgi:hypothetical protein
MGDVINFNNSVTYLDIDPKEMMKEILDQIPIESAIVLTWSGETMTVFSSNGNTAEIVYTLELAKKQILDVAGE